MAYDFSIEDTLRDFARKHTCKRCKKHSKDEYCAYRDNGDEHICEEVEKDFRALMAYVEGEE